VALRPRGRRQVSPSNHSAPGRMRSRGTSARRATLEARRAVRDSRATARLAIPPSPAPRNLMQPHPATVDAAWLSRAWRVAQRRAFR